MLDVLGPLHIPKHPLVMAGFGLKLYAAGYLFFGKWFSNRTERGIIGGHGGAFYATLAIGPPHLP